MENHHQHQHATGTDSAAETDWAAMAELLDLDAEVLHSYLSEMTGWVHELAADLPCRRILDLGAGTGTGALALLQRFEGADVIALDMSGPAACTGSGTRPAISAWPTGSAPYRRTWTRRGRPSTPSTWRGRPCPCTTWQIPIASSPRSSPRSAPAGCWRWPRWAPSRASCPTTSASAAPDSKRAAMPPWPRDWPASYRISAPTGARRCARPASPSRPSGPSPSI